MEIQRLSLPPTCNEPLFQWEQYVLFDGLRKPPSCGFGQPTIRAILSQPSAGLVHNRRNRHPRTVPMTVASWNLTPRLEIHRGWLGFRTILDGLIRCPAHHITTLVIDCETLNEMIRREHRAEE